MDFLLHLHALPATAAYASYMLAGAITAALTCALLAPIVRAPQTKEMLDVAMRTTGGVTAALTLTLTLAFCAVRARNDRAEADRALRTELAAILGFARVTARVGPAAEALPSDFWMLILLLFSLVVAIGPLYPLRAHVIAMLAIQAAGLSALIAFLFLIEWPFQGVMGLSPEPYRVLQHGPELRAAPMRQVRTTH